MTRVTSVAIVAVFVLTMRANAQSADSSRPFIPDRDPVGAAVLGAIIPGMGHVYAGEYVRGARLYLTAVSGIGGGLMMYYIDRCSFTWDPCNPGPAWPHQSLGIAMMAVGAGVWVYSAIDAPRAVHRREAARESARRTSLLPPLSQWKPTLMAAPGTVHGALIGATATF